MDTLVRSLDRMIAQSPDANALRKDTQLSAIIGKFFAGVREQMEDVQKGSCVDSRQKQGAGH